MAVVGTRYTTGFGSIQTLGTAIHAALILQGWTIEYANADAIGTGSASNPAWTKTPPNAAITSAGIVVYRMPSFSVLNRWYLQIEFFWAANVNNCFFTRFTTAQGVNSGTGVLVSAGTTYGTSFNQNNGPNSNGESWLGAWEHGILLSVSSLGGINNGITGFERRRGFDGNVQDDCVSYLCLGAGATGIGFGGSNSSDNMVRSWTVGERTAEPLALLLGQSSSAAGASRAITTFNQPSGNTGYPMGFYTTSGGLGGTVRLMQLWWLTDSNNLSSQDVYVDGANRQYFGASTTITPNGQRLLLAQN